ncbi:MAG: hypothetical protein JST54_35210 [Deltaproteobacteria bacterium]|nr:hypothetical protein [Deltaproteobacteria bacterium]
MHPLVPLVATPVDPLPEELPAMPLVEVLVLPVPEVPLAPIAVEEAEPEELADGPELVVPAPDAALEAVDEGPLVEVDELLAVPVELLAPAVADDGEDDELPLEPTDSWVLRAKQIDEELSQYAALGQSESDLQ